MCFIHFLQVFLFDEEGPISPFHDVPLVAQEHPKTFHVVIEVTRKASSLKGLSHEIDFKNFDKKLHNLA